MVSFPCFVLLCLQNQADLELFWEIVMDFFLAQIGSHSLDYNANPVVLCVLSDFAAFWGFLSSFFFFFWIWFERWLICVSYGKIVSFLVEIIHFYFLFYNNLSWRWFVICSLYSFPKQVFTSELVWFCCSFRLFLINCLMIGVVDAGGEITEAVILLKYFDLFERIL